MAFTDRIKQFFAQLLSLTDEKAWNPHLWNIGGYQSQAGENVDEFSALTYSAFWNAVTLLSGTIGALPLHLMQKKDKKKRRAENKYLYQVMHDEWNPFMAAMTGRETMVAHILTWGNGFAEIVRDGMGEIRQLWPIPPNRVRVKMEGGTLIYEIDVDGEKIYLPRERILHIPGLGFDGFVGYSVVRMANKAIGLGMAMETFGSLYFGQGTHPGLVVSHPGELSETAHRNLQSDLTTKYGNLGKSHKILLLEEGMKVEKIGIPPDDSQFLESRQFQITDIARWFNLPVHKLKEMTKSSFNNIQEEQQSFVTDSILPWLVRLEANYNMQLLTPSDRDLSGRGRLYFKHSVEGLLRGDAKSRGEFYKAMFSVGAMSPNDIREKEDEDPIPGGDVYLVPMNMVTVQNAGKPQEEPDTPALPPRRNGEDTTDEDRARRNGQ